MLQVEMDPEKQLKIKSGFFLKRVNISVNQTINGDSKGVNNRHTIYVTGFWKNDPNCTFEVLR